MLSCGKRGTRGFFGLQIRSIQVASPSKWKAAAQLKEAGLQSLRQLKVARNEARNDSLFRYAKCSVPCLLRQPP